MGNKTIAEDKIARIINNQSLPYLHYDVWESFISVKDELTILGRALIRKEVPRYYPEVFQTGNVKEMWRIILKKKFNFEEEELCSAYIYNIEESKISFSDFIQATKQLAENISDYEFKIVCEKVEKYYEIREICRDIYDNVHIDSNIESKDEKFFLKRCGYLENSLRLETLSIHQIKKLLTPNSIVDTTDVVYSATSLTKGLVSLFNTEIKDTNKGVELAFPLITRATNGLRKGQLIATGMFSNNGKTRLMIRVVANLVLKQNKKVLIISNEMTEEDIMYCFITTVINNPEFKDMFATTDITENERDIRNTNYQDSEEEDKVKDIVKTLEKRFANHILIIHTDSYSDEVLTEIILKHYLEDNIDYFFYDTLKSDKNNMANWDGLKITTTVLSELAKTYDICVWGNIQLNDTSKKSLDINSNDIASSKQIYQLLDTLFLFSPIDKKDYTEYRYWEGIQIPRKEIVKELEPNKTYYICRINKNRLGAKPNLLFEVNLNKNTWEEVGQVAYYNDIKRFLI